MVDCQTVNAGLKEEREQSWLAVGALRPVNLETQKKARHKKIRKERKKNRISLKKMKDDRLKNKERMNQGEKKKHMKKERAGEKGTRPRNKNGHKMI